jgi:hypothetical protein
MYRKLQGRLKEKLQTISLEVRVAIEHTRIGKVRRASVRQPAYKNII